MKLALFSTATFATAFLVACSPDDGAPTNLAPDPVQARSSALSSTGKPGKCKLVKLPGTDPNKPLEYECKTKQPAKPKSPDPKLVAKQKLYLAEWKKQSATWTGLSAKQQEAKRQALKESILGQGGQP